MTAIKMSEMIVETESVSLAEIETGIGSVVTEAETELGEKAMETRS